MSNIMNIETKDNEIKIAIDCIHQYQEAIEIKRRREAIAREIPSLDDIARVHLFWTTWNRQTSNQSDN